MINITIRGSAISRMRYCRDEVVNGGSSNAVLYLIHQHNNNII